MSQMIQVGESADTLGIVFVLEALNDLTGKWEIVIHRDDEGIPTPLVFPDERMKDTPEFKNLSSAFAGRFRFATYRRTSGDAKDNA